MPHFLVQLHGIIFFLLLFFFLLPERAPLLILVLFNKSPMSPNRVKQTTFLTSLPVAALALGSNIFSCRFGIRYPQRGKGDTIGVIMLVSYRLSFFFSAHFHTFLFRDLLCLARHHTTWAWVVRRGWSFMHSWQHFCFFVLFVFLLLFKSCP